MKTLFLNPPSFEGFDGGAGSRYQAKREIRSFWYPTWLAQAAALVPESRLIDAPADELSVKDVLRRAQGFELIIVYTSTPSFEGDARLAAEIKAQDSHAMIGFVGPHVSVLPEESLRAAPAVDFVARKEFDYSAREVALRVGLADVPGLSWRDGDVIRHNPEAPLITDLESLPSVIDVYRRDLIVENYYIGYLMHPYLSLYTGRGCPGRCTFCLWPQTMLGHTYRARSAGSVYEELARAKEMFPEVKEFFIDDDTFTANPSRAVEIAGLLGKLGITWSTSARLSVQMETLKALKESGLRLLMVGFESGSDEILRRSRKGLTTDMARKFMANCRALGIKVHGTFMFGLPGETRQTVEQTIRYACELDPDTIQVSVATPYPGTALYDEAIANGWMADGHLVSGDGTQTCVMRYDDLTSRQILDSVDSFYKRFYLRPRVIFRMAGGMIRDRSEMRRRLREGKEFLSFLRRQDAVQSKNAAARTAQQE